MNKNKSLWLITILLISLGAASCKGGGAGEGKKTIPANNIVSGGNTLEKSESLSSAASISKALSSSLEAEAKILTVSNPVIDSANLQELNAVKNDLSNLTTAKTNNLMEASKSIINCSTELSFEDCEAVVNKSNQ